MSSKETRRKVQTTLRLPTRLYEQARLMVQSGATSAGNLNELMVAALRAHLNTIRRRLIDAAFAGMAGDTRFQDEAQQLAEEFEESDSEALDIIEKGRRGN